MSFQKVKKLLPLTKNTLTLAVFDELMNQMGAF